MAIKPPAWAKQAVPTTRGWQNPSTGEILVGGSISEAAIAAWHEEMNPKPAPKPKRAPRVLRESPVTEEEATEELFEDAEEAEEEE